MQKMFALIPKRADMSLAQFGRHWRAVHGPLACGIEALLGYSQNHQLPGGVPGFRLASYAGISTAWLAGATALDSLVNDPVYLQRVATDELNFQDIEKKVYLEVREGDTKLRLTSVNADDVKAMLFLRRRDVFDRPSFRRAISQALNLASGHAGLEGYRENVVVADTSARRDGSGVELVLELWWEGSDAYAQYWDSSEGEALRAALMAVCSGSSEALLVRELRLK